MSEGGFSVRASGWVIRQAVRLGVPADFEAEVERELVKGRAFVEPPDGVEPLRGNRDRFVDLGGGVLVRVELGDLAKGGARRATVRKIESDRETIRR